MSYVYYNPNPLKLSVGDCTIRAISCALNMSWKETYLALCTQGFQMYDMPSANRVWGEYLKSKGFKKYLTSCHTETHQGILQGVQFQLL